MKHYMFDTNIFNNILDKAYNMTQIIKADCSYHVTHIQLDELSNTPNKERREQLLKVFRTIPTKKELTESAVWDISKWDEAKYASEPECENTESTVLGISKLGNCKLSDGVKYENILTELARIKPKQEMNNKKDALIAETAMKNGYTLVTEDNALYETVLNLQGEALKLDQYLGN